MLDALSAAEEIQNKIRSRISFSSIEAQLPLR
jgi:hypothetical protein